MTGSRLSRLPMAVSQHAEGVTGDQHSPWTRMGNTHTEMLGVATRWADSVSKTGDAWSKINDPATPGGPPPSTGEVALRVLNATKDSVGVVMSGLGLAKEALDVGFANLTAPLAAITPSLPAATIGSPYVGTPHCHPLHPPSGPPPIPPTPLPSFGSTMLGPGPRVLVNYMPAARVEDIGLAPTCMGLPPQWFKIKTGSSNVFFGGNRAARLGDVCKACKNIPEPPTRSAGKAMQAIGKAAEVAGDVQQAAGIVAGGLGMAASVGESVAADDPSMAAAHQMAAATAAAQMAIDAAKMAVEATIWKDLTAPPTGSIGAIVDPSHVTVLVGGFPMIDIPDPVGAILNRLKQYKPRQDADTDGTGPPPC